MFILVFKYLKRIKYLLPCNPSIALTCNKVTTYQHRKRYLLPATKLPFTSHHQMHLPCNAKHCTYPQRSCHIPRITRCTYLAMPNIALTCNKVASYLAAQSDALTFQCLALHLPATKLPHTSQRQAMRLPCNAKHCTYLQQSCLLPRSAKRCAYLAMPSIALTCNKVASYLASSSDALTLHRPAMHFPATPRVAITFLQRKALQRPPPQSCPSHISTYHSPCVQPPVR